MQQAGYCPRGLFCAFAHVEPEEPSRDHALDCATATSLAELLSSALPPDRATKADSPPASQLQAQTPHANGADASECASTSSGGSGGRRPFATDPDLGVKSQPPPVTQPQAHHAWAQRAPQFDATVLQEVVGNALDELHLEDPLNLVAALDRDIEAEVGVGGPCASAPVNIPGPGGRGLRGFSPPPVAGGSPLPAFLRYAPPEPERAFNSHAIKAGSFGGGGTFEFGASPSAPAELSRLREEVVASRAAVARWDERIAQARSACEAWKRESDEAQRKMALAERQRDEALAHAMTLRRELEAARAAGAGVAGRRELRGMPLTTLKAMQVQARADLEEIEKVLYLETATKCMVCEEQPRSVTLAPCNHYVLCEACAATSTECPYCQTPVQHH